MSTIACWITDANPRYLDYLEVCLRSFTRYNRNIPRVVWALADYAGVESRFSPWAEVVDRTSDLYHPPGSLHPIALARCKALAEIPARGDTLVNLDADGIFYGSIEPTLERHYAFGHAISMNLETDPRFTCLLIHDGFKHGAVPSTFFPEQRRWLNHAFLNTGFIVASPAASAIGQKAVELFPHVGPTLRFGEQGLINAIIHEQRIPFGLIPFREHCTGLDQYFTHPGEPYIEAPILDGKPIVFKHFAGEKRPLDRHLPALLAHWRAQP